MNCYSCDKELWPAKYDGLVVVSPGGDPRCEECKEVNKPWLEKYRTRK